MARSKLNRHDLTCVEQETSLKPNTHFLAIIIRALLSKSGHGRTLTLKNRAVSDAYYVSGAYI